MTAKRSGRVRDSALIGAGTFADDRGSAVSATGNGEVFICHAAAVEVAERMRQLDEGVADAANDVVFKDLL